MLFCCSLSANEPAKTSSQNKNNKQEKVAKKETKLDWGDWNKKYKPQQRYGVGIKGKLQSAISQMDKSNLINNSSGVSVSPAKNKTKKSSVNIKKMKAEIKALEKKVEQEINHDIDY